MRRLGTLLLLVGCASGCVGPISDWPHKNSGADNDDNRPMPGVDDPTSSTANPGSGAGAGGTATGTPGGTVGGQGATPPVTTGSAGGAASGVAGGGSAIGGGAGGAGTSLLGGGTGGAGGLFGGTSADAGVGAFDGGSDASPPSDPNVDAGASDAGAAEGGAADAGCAPVGDAGLVGSCPAYGCSKTLAQLGAAATPMGACNAAMTLPLVCDGEIGRAAVQCAQDSTFSFNLSRSIAACLRRLPALTQVSAECLSCYADETLCTLSRCFVTCIDGADPACRQCRHDQCGGALSQCSGLPSP